MKRLGLIVFVFYLAACGAQVIPSRQTLQSLLTPTSDSTAYASSMPTAQLSTPFPTFSPTPDKTELAVQVAQGDCATVGLESKISPDRLWLASPCFFDGNAIVRIARFDGLKIWELSFEDITGTNPCWHHRNSYGDDVCFYGILYIDHWYKDSRYVFITADYLIDRGTNFIFGLYRIDTQTGRISPYLPLSNSTYVFAFSPNDENYAYVTGSDNYLLHIVSIETGRDTSVVVPGSYSSIGELLWAPDNEKLVLITRGIGWESSTAGFSLVMLEVKSGKFTILISNDLHKLRPVRWQSDDNLILQGLSADGQAYIDYQFSISSNQLSPMPNTTPTP